jgi:tRNA(fMet)-specific endonuclease VapC
LLLLDTSVAVALRENMIAVGDRFARLRRLPSLSVVSVIELEGGVTVVPEGRDARRRVLDQLYDSLEILPFGEAEAAAYRRIIEQCGFSRRLIIDRMIASQAIAARATLATLNPRDFREISDLDVADWSPKS